MKRYKNIAIGVSIVLAGIGNVNVFAEDQLKDVFSGGKVSGNLRAYYNTREYEVITDEAAFALGGALRAETGKIAMISAGLGYYTAQDLGTNSDDPDKVNPRLGSDLEVLGEAYIDVSNEKFRAVAGRHLVNTPMANAGDAFIVPFTFQGYTLIDSHINGLTLQANYLNEIKNRNSDEFLDVGLWTSNRYGLSAPVRTEGALNVGVQYKLQDSFIEAWYSKFTDFFDSIYLKGESSFEVASNIKPFIGLQFATQKESGDALLGTVDTTLYGIQVGSKFAASKITLAFNSVDEQENAFRNGAFLAPYSFSTSPLFTNNMLTTFENVDAGEATKLTFNQAFGSSIALKISYATFDYLEASDRDAIDFDITYNFKNYFNGLSFRYRLEVVSADDESVEQTNNRFQLQFVF